MKHTVQTIIAAYKNAPAELRGFDTPAARAFHGWLFGLVLDCLAPDERLVIMALVRVGELSTAELIEAVADTHTPQQVGSTLSRLRKLELIWTIRSQGVAYHDLDGWARIGGPMWRGQP